MANLICNIGINDSKTPRTKTINRRRVWSCPYYLVWKAMLERCYSPQKQKALKNYNGVTVCEEWLLFSTFQSWMKTQNWKKKRIDKDIIKPGNKLYSPETCCFVDDKINSLLTQTKNRKSDYAQGVCWDKYNRNYKTAMSLYGVNTNLGGYDTEKEASQAYKKAKSSHILSVAKTISDQRIRDGLIKHAQYLLWSA